MVLTHRIQIITAVIFLLTIKCSIEAKKIKPSLCPIGFNVAYTYEKEAICYRLKGPERVDDIYQNCAGNLYTSKLHNSLNITRTEIPLWTEYRSLYPAGPFVDWSYSATTGEVLPRSFSVPNDRNFSVNVGDVNLCMVINPTGEFIATSCDGEYYRYCFVEPYRKDQDLSREGCEGLEDFWRLWSPIATCLAVVNGHSGGAVRATWSQSQGLCKKRGGILLNKGWRYSNSPLLRIPDPGEHRAFPLGYHYDPESHTLQTYENSTRLIPRSDWNFADSLPNVTGYAAVANDLWYLVNDTYVFFNVICEKSLDLRPVGLNITVNEENQLILHTDTLVDKDAVSCFTDSEGFSPEKVKLSRYNKTEFILKPVSNGYYWCIINASRKYLPSESNRALFVRVKESLKSEYAIKIRLKDKKYELDSVKPIFKEYCERKLEQYVFYYTTYFDFYGELFPTYDQLTEFRNTHPELDGKEKDVIHDVVFKRLYLDQRTILAHLELKSTMKPVPPGEWDGIEVIYMKPTYNCFHEGQYFHDSLTVGCDTHTCVGDYNEGVQVVTTRQGDCLTTPGPVLLRNQVTVAMPTVTSIVLSSTSMHDVQRENHGDSSEESTERVPKPTTNPPEITTTYEPTTTDPTEVVTVTTGPTEVVTVTTGPTEVVTATTRPPQPTSTEPPTPLPPEDQLQQVIDDLQTLLNNTDEVSLDNIGVAFDQVDELLESTIQLDIPGNLLHLLDKIGARISLNGSEKVTAIRGNIALLVADAEPALPVRGLRIAARDTDMFTEGSFEIIRTEVNSTHLTSNDSEVVVQLPESIGNSTRRISFVVFRNDRAFQSNVYSVNSRVLSVNVENLTKFEQNEVVDIHFSPFTGDPNRNESRACAFWHFLEDGSGYWSQEGCTFIEATVPGMLDTCRCDHLTHFAEVLVPRAVFSERNEYILELLTVIGCCLSIIGVAVVGLTALLFRSWRKDFVNKVWLQLCVAIFCLMLLFLIVVYAQFNEYDVPCMLLGVALHYFVLASFCWMLVAAVLSYRRLVLVFTRGTSHKLLKASAFSWGAPCAVVGILLSISPLSYTGRFEEKSPTGAFCYPSGLALWLAVYAPIAIMLLANWTLFVCIVRSVFASRRIPRHGDSNEALRCASVSCLLVFLFGLPWLFGLFAYNVVAAYFFTITATFQGFVLFLFFVVGNKKTRDMWLNKLKIKQTRKVPVTSSTYTNRSTGPPGLRGGGQNSIEVKVTKPKSLQAPDDSRFS